MSGGNIVKGEIRSFRYVKGKDMCVNRFETETRYELWMNLHPKARATPPKDPHLHVPHTTLPGRGT